MIQALVGAGVGVVGSVIASGQQTKLAKTTLATAKEQTAYYQQITDLQKNRLAQLQAELSKPEEKKKMPVWVWYAIGGGGLLAACILIYFLTRNLTRKN